MEYATIALLLVNSGALVMLGRMDMKLKYLCKSDVKLDGRVTVLEQHSPTQSSQPPAAQHRSCEV